MFFPLFDICNSLIFATALSAAPIFAINVGKITIVFAESYLFEEKETLKHYINNNVILTYKKGTKIKELYFICAVWGLTLAITTPSKSFLIKFNEAMIFAVIS